MIANSILGIKPVGWSRLKAAAQRNQNVLRNGLSIESDFLCLRAVNPEMHVRLIEWLLNSRVCNPGNVPDMLEQCVGIRPIACQIIAGYLDVDGSRQPEIQNLAHHVGRQERKGHAGKLLGQADTEVVNVLCGFVMVDGKSDKNIRVRGSYCSRVVVGSIDAAIGQPNIVNHIGDFTRRQLLPDGPLDEIAQTRGFLDARAGRRSKVEIERAAVSRGEEVLP